MRLRGAELARLAERTFSGGAVLLGILAGAFLVSHLTSQEAAVLWAFAGFSGFGLGLKLGQGALRGTTLVMVLVITLLTALGNA